MAKLEDRGEGFERKFAHDAELKFKAEARRNKHLGVWAAEKMGKGDTEAYAKEVVMADFQEAGDEDVFRKVKADLDAAGAGVTDGELRAKMSELLAQAVAEIENS